MRTKIPALREALEGRSEPHYALVIGAILAHLDFLDGHIDRLSEAIEEQLGPFAPGVPLAARISGVADRTAQVMIAELGTDMSRFPTAAHLASGKDAAQQRPIRRQATLRSHQQGIQMASRSKYPPLAATRTNDTYLQAKYQRLRPRIGHRRALVAVQRSMLVAHWHRFTTGETYRVSVATTSENATRNAKPAARRTAPSPRTPSHPRSPGITPTRLPISTAPVLRTPDHLGQSDPVGRIWGPC